MRDRLHALAIARNVLTLERARLIAFLATPAVTLPPAVRAAAGAALARLDADLARLAREEAALHAAEHDGDLRAHRRPTVATRADAAAARRAGPPTGGVWNNCDWTRRTGGARPASRM